MRSIADEEQRIERLTHFGDALNALDRLVKPVAPRDCDVADAIDRVLAANVVAAKRPARSLALHDGFAVRAEDLTDASSYAPITLARIPLRVETGDELPDDADTVAPVEHIVVNDGVAEAVQPVTAGEGVLPAGSETDAAKPLREAGERIRATDLAVLMAAEIARVSVRVPRVRIAVAREDLRLTPALQAIARDCAARGGEALVRNGLDLDDALKEQGADAVIVIGGTGSGPRDRSVMALAKAGTVAVHGVGLSPGHSTAFGRVGTWPVLVVPGRLDAALASWLIFGRSLVDRLTCGTRDQNERERTLTRKVTSTIGLAELVPVRCRGDQAEPLAKEHLPLSALSRADGWFLIEPDSEGFAAGTPVAVRDWP